MTYPDTPDARLSAMARIIDTLTEHADRPVTCGAAPATILPAGVAPTEQPHVAQLDRVGNFYFLGCRFESCRAGQITPPLDTWGSTEIAMIAGKRPDQVARELEGQ